MKRLFLWALAWAIGTSLSAQPQGGGPKGPGAQPGQGEQQRQPGGEQQDVAQYQLFVFQDKGLASKFGQYWSQQVEGLRNNRASRGLLGNAFASAKMSAGSAAYTTLSGLVSTGVNLVGNMVKSKKGEWMQLVERENRFEKTIMTLQNLDDFYSDISTVSALDPSNIAFNGFGCLQMRDRDTVLYLACHLDTTQQAFSRIFRHSKFQLQVDTLVFNPYKCDLPNDSSCRYSERHAFSFDERDNLNLKIDATFTSSWINQAIQVHANQELGNFSLQVPIRRETLDKRGLFRFVRGRAEGNSVADVQMLGECFIVPRSYVGVCDEDGNYADAWGTGQYKVTLKLKETCDVARQLAEGSNWKADWKRRRQEASSHKPSPDLQSRISQAWDANGSRWVVTLLDGPAQSLAAMLLGAVGIQQSQQAAAQQPGGAGQPGAAQQPQGAQQQGAQQPQGGNGQPPQRP